MPSRTPDEVFLFGAIYIHAAPEKYVQFAENLERRRQLSGYLALGALSSPPRLEDFKGFSLDADDVQALKNCKPGDCLIQVPASAIDEFQKRIDWTATDTAEQVNRRLQEGALRRILEYQRDGNPALGIYNDKRDPVEVPRKLEYLLSYSKVLPARLPEFYSYLLKYPGGKPANVDDRFYWEHVKFGLKPTLRVLQVITMRGSTADDRVSCAVAEKQLYASHYFETALDLSFCVRDEQGAEGGFYLIKLMASEQAGLTGLKGSILRRTAVGRSLSNLQAGLSLIQRTLETNEPAPLPEKLAGAKPF